MDYRLYISCLAHVAQTNHNALAGTDGRVETDCLDKIAPVSGGYVKIGTRKACD